MANIAYIRVSSNTQNTGRQHEEINRYAECRGIIIDKVFEEKISGKNIKDRPQFNAMMNYIREGDIVFIESISRLSRSIRDFLDTVQKFQDLKVELVSLKENIVTNNAQGRFILTVFAALAQLEREQIRQRQREGIDLALKEHRPYGRRKISLSKTFEKNYTEWKAEGITAVEFMKRENLSKTTFYRKVKEYESTLN